MPGNNWRIDLAWLTETLGIKPRTVCECGVGPLDISVAPSFVGKCKRLLLIEPVPDQAAAAELETGVEVHRVAIARVAGEVDLVLNGGSSYIHGTWAPTPVHNNTISVQAVTFDTLDDGQIDVLNLDCEGMEWFVLSQMRSIPRIIKIEIWEGNPYKGEIKNWLLFMGYKCVISTGPTSEEHVFICT